MRDTCASLLVSCTGMNVSHPPTNTDWLKNISDWRSSPPFNSRGKLDAARKTSPLKFYEWAPGAHRYCKITAGSFQNHAFIVQRCAFYTAFFVESARAAWDPTRLVTGGEREKKTRISPPGTVAPSKSNIRKKDKNPPNLPPVYSARPGVGLIYGCFDRTIGFPHLILPSPSFMITSVSAHIILAAFTRNKTRWSRLRLRSEQKTDEWLFREPPPLPTPWNDLAFAAAGSQGANSNLVFFFGGSFLQLFGTHLSRRALFFYECARKRRRGAWGIWIGVSVIIDPYLHTDPSYLTHSTSPSEKTHLFRDALAGCHFLGKSLASLGSDSLCIIPMAFQELASTLNLVFIASPKRIWENLSHPPKLPTSIYVHPPQRLFSENDRSISPSPEDATFFFAYAPATIRFPSLRSQT